MNNITSSIIFGVACLLGCDPEFEAPTSSPVVVKPFDQLKADARSQYSKVNAEILAFLNQAPSCSKESRQGFCETVNVGFTPKRPTKRSKGQRILVIDEGMRLAAYTRYKSRVFDDIEADMEGVYHSVSRDVEISRGMLYVLSTILDERYPDTPALALQDIYRNGHSRLDMLFAPNYQVAHGEVIFGTLADLNPEAEFVIAQIPKMFGDKISRFQTENEVIATITAYLENLSSSLIAKIREYELNFVNMSFGETVHTLKERLESQVSPMLNSKHFYRRVLQVIKEHFYDRLFALSDVIFVQAAASSLEELNENVSGYAIDCTPYPNRIRASFIERLETDIPHSGAYQSHLISTKKNAKCVDVFFNTGVVLNEELDPVRGKHPYLMSADGVGTNLLGSSFTNSWATPFILSYLNFRKQEAKAKEYRFEVEKLLDSRFILEPTKYGNFEIFRLGRLR